jgi:hypothetical protein
LSAEGDDRPEPFDGGRRGAGHGLRLDELRDVPVVVVLGERGAGKSVALQQEYDLLSRQGAKVAPMLHLGRDVDTTSAGSILQQHLGDAGEDPRYVLLDGLDEALNDVPGLDKTLWLQLRSLPDRQRERLRLRITCRTSRWPKQLLSQLGERWPDPGQIEVMTLEPLTRQDVVTAAEQRGLNAHAFAERVTGRGLEALSQQPVTLIPLLDAQADGKELPRTVAEAYEQACRRLCKESWDQRFEQRQTRPTVDHLLEVARWAAAALQFSRIPALTEQEPVSKGALSLDSLSGPGVPGIVPPLECRLHELLHLTESGLLMAVGHRRWVFAHRSYQEYLAAQYLRDRIAPAVQNELLWAGSGPARYIVPEHEEVAARLAAEVPELFEELLIHHPRVLLLSDLPSLPDTSRQRVTQALLDAAPSEGSALSDFTFLERLAHPTLAGQLAPFLDHDVDWNQAYLALCIAAQCRLAELTPALLTFAQNTAVSARFRSFALYAIAHQTVKGDAVTALRGLASDTKTNVAEAALELLWPGHLQLTEYLDLLPTRRSWTYRPQLDKTMDLVTAEHVGEALDWCIKTLEVKGPKSLTATALLARCIRLIGDAAPAAPAPGEKRAGQALVALAAHTELSHTIDARTPLEYLHDALDAAPALRRRLADHLLRHGSQEHVWELTLSTPEVGLFPQQDLLYWAERWPDLPPEVRRTALPLFSHRNRPDDEQLREALDNARQADEELKNATAWWDAPPPDWQLRRQEQEEEQRRLHTYDEDQFSAALDAVRTAEPQKVRAAWRTAIGHLYRTSDGQSAEVTSWLTAVATAPSCPPNGSALRAKLLDAALHVLTTAPVWTARDVRGGGGDCWTDVPELAATGFVPTSSWETAVPAADVGRWAGWALALATMILPAPDQEQHSTLFTWCARQAGPAFETALATCLDQLQPHVLIALTRFLHTVDATIALALVRDWAAAPGRSDEAWAAVTITLSNLGDSLAQTRVKQTVAAGPPNDEHDPHPERWITAARTVMSYEDLPENWPYIRRAFDDPELCRAVVDSLIESGSDRWPPGVAQLSESDLADFYERLCLREELGRPRPEHEPGVAYPITPQETLHDLADGLLQRIADKQTPQAADHLSRLAASTSRQPARVSRLARHTARQAAQQDSQPVSPDQLRKLAADHSLRVITDEAQLLDVVMEALDRVQEALSGPNGMSILLWNRTTAAGYSTMWPAWEEDFSDLVMGLLKIHLVARRTILNREVQVDRPGAQGGRTDIHIQAAESAQDTEPVTVVIEAKGCWHSALSTALADQLVTRYLRRPRTAGIYLVGFFDCDQWNSEHRPRCSSGHTHQQIEQEQQKLAAEQDALVRARVLDCRPPGAQIR